MSIFEYDEDKHIKSEKELSYQEGLRQGEELGLRQGKELGLKRGEERLNMLNKRLLDENRMEDLKLCITDEKYRKKLFAEYDI